MPIAIYPLSIYHEMNFTRLFDIIQHQVEHYPLSISLAGKPSGKWQVYGTRRIITLANRLSKGLLALGIKEGDKIALISDINRPEWNIIDIATLQIGAVLVPVYASLTTKKSLFVLKHADAKICIVNNSALYHKIESIKYELPALTHIYTIDDVERAVSWKRIMEFGSHISNKTLTDIKANISPQSLATIIYTSGTTGDPKGVMLSHQNIVSNIKSVLSILPLEPYKKAVSLLPLSHIFERTVTYIYMSVGVSIYHVDNLTELKDYLEYAQPNYLVTVPSLLEKIYEQTQKKILKEPIYKKKVFDWAIKVGQGYDINNVQSWWYKAKIYLARKLFFNNWKKILGGEIEAIVVSASALQPKLCQLFNAAGIPVREGYGLTEASPIIALNYFEDHGAKLGTVGRIIPAVEVKISPIEKEILVRGENVMLGYYKDETLTKQTIDKDGWLHTGDIGHLEDGFLKITDRKKELFKIATGSKIAPQLLENKLRESLFISQVMIVGEHEDFVGALIVPDFEYLGQYCQENKLPFSSQEEMIEYPEVITKIYQVVDNYNINFSREERIEKIALLPTSWTAKKGEVTPSLKLKRKVIKERYNNLIEELYNKNNF